MAQRRCSDCQVPFFTDRLSDTKCLECRSPRPDAAGRLEDHRRDVIRASIGAATFDLVVQSLAAEGFVVAPPSAVPIPVDWFVRFLELAERAAAGRHDLPQVIDFASLAAELPPRLSALLAQDPAR